RGQLLGDEAGMLKLLIHEETRHILGVHAIGSGATELIHIGQIAIALKATVDYFINNVFNYPTLAECYKVAALNGSNKLRHLWQSYEVATTSRATRVREQCDLQDLTLTTTGHAPAATKPNQRRRLVPLTPDP